jgi:hypothetical protein
LLRNIVIVENVIDPKKVGGSAAHDFIDRPVQKLDTIMRLSALDMNRLATMWDCLAVMLGIRLIG